MGRAAKQRQQRQIQRLFQGVFALEAQEAKDPCASCAFRDPEAWIADPAMGHKVTECLTGKGAHDFFCHQGLVVAIRPDGTRGAYQVPLTAEGKPDVSQLTRCGGFLRWAVKYRFASWKEKMQAVHTLQRKMCERYLAGNFDHSAHFREVSGGRADVMQEALNMESLGYIAGDEDD